MEAIEAPRLRATRDKYARWLRTRFAERRRVSWFRYSLRTLLLAAFLCGSGMLCDKNAEPWYLDRVLPGEFHDLYSLAVSPSGLFFIGGCHAAHLWEPAKDAQPRRLPAPDEARALASGSFSADGRRVATAGEAVRVYDTATGAEQLVIEAPAESVALSPDGQRIAALESDSVRIWNAATGAEERVLKGVVFSDAGASNSFSQRDHRVSFSADGRRVLVVCEQWVWLWDPDSAATPSSLSWNRYWIVAAVFHNNEPRIATLGKSGILRVWDEGDEPRSELAGMSGPGAVGAFSPDCSRFIAVGPQGDAVIWDLATDREVARLHTGFHAVAPVISPDLNTVVAPGDANTVQIWRRRRPEYWYGVAWLWEFWLTVAFGMGLLWSVWHDRRTLPQAPQP